MAPDLLDEVRLAFEIHAPSRHRDFNLVPAHSRRETDRGECFHRFMRRRGVAEQAGATGQAHRQRARNRRGGTLVDHPRGRRRAGELREKPRGQILRQNRRLGIAASLEALAGVGRQAQSPGGCAHRGRRKPSRLDENVLRRGSNLRGRAADHAGECDGARVVRDDEHLGSQGPIDPVERAQGLARFRAPHPNRETRERLEVEKMHRLAELEEDQVRRVDDVVDRAESARRETRDDPVRRRAHGHAAHHPRGVAAAHVGGEDRHHHGRRSAGGGGGGKTRCQREPERCRHFARDPEVA